MPSRFISTVSVKVLHDNKLIFSSIVGGANDTLGTFYRKTLVIKPTINLKDFPVSIVEKFVTACVGTEHAFVSGIVKGKSASRDVSSVINAIDLVIQD